MAYEIVENFAAGLDTRKSPLTAPGGTLTRLTNAVINPGGEIEKRRAFVKVADVPSSFGLATTGTNLYVFGRNITPPAATLTADGTALAAQGVNIIEQLIPNADVNLDQTDFDVFDGYIYLVCRAGFTGALPTYPTEAQNPHYYNTNLTEGAGKGFYVRTYKSKVYAVKGKYLYFSATDNPAVWDDETLIDSVVVTTLTPTNPVRCTVSSADISRFSNGMRVNIAGATVAGLTGANGFHTIGNVGAIANTFSLTGVNGTTATASQTDLKVRATPGIRITDISNTDFARCKVAVGDIGKFSEGQKIFIEFVTGSMVSGNFVVTDINLVDYTFALLNVHAAGYPAPQTADTWAVLTSDVLRSGNGYINLSVQDADAEKLTSIEVYYDKLAIFTTESVQLWAVASDPNANSMTQLLRDAGTEAPRSPLQYGSGDVLYLDRSGVRSLKARDSSNSAAVSDIGSPIDPTVRKMRLTLSETDMNRAISLLEPSVGRFWMIFPDRVMALSYFPGPKVTAWSESTMPELGGATVTHAVSCDGRIFLRTSNNQIWVYGGANGNAYNNPGVEIRLPYLNGKKPGNNKMFEAIDLTMEGTWTCKVSFDFNNPDNEEIVGTFAQSTWNGGRAELTGYASHISLRFYNNDSAYASISNVGVHYQVLDDEQ